MSVLRKSDALDEDCTHGEWAPDDCTHSFQPRLPFQRRPAPRRCARPHRACSPLADRRSGRPHRGACGVCVGDRPRSHTAQSHCRAHADPREWYLIDLGADATVGQPQFAWAPGTRPGPAGVLWWLESGAFGLLVVVQSAPIQLLLLAISGGPGSGAVAGPQRRRGRIRRLLISPSSASHRAVPGDRNHRRCRGQRPPRTRARACGGRGHDRGVRPCLLSFSRGLGAVRAERRCR